MKKQKLKRIISMILCLIFITGGALASDAYGPKVYETNIEIGEGTELVNALFWSDTYSKLRAESYIEYTPNATVMPVIDYGTSIRSFTNMTAVADRLKAKGLTMVGGTNGDYFSMATGESLGIVITDGILRSSSSYHWAVGFNADGTAIIGRPMLKIYITTADGERFQIADINKPRTQTEGAVLYNSDYSATTCTYTDGINVIMENPSDAFRVGGTVTAAVKEVVHTTDAVPLGENQLVLSLDALGDQWRTGLMDAMQAGDSIKIEIVSDDTRWDTVSSAVGGMYRLVEGGAANKGLESTTPTRTAIGVKADGTVVFYTAASTTNGAATTLDQVAVRLVEMGCVDAMCLDGGGSTTLNATYPGGTTPSLINNTAYGTIRNCSNYIVLGTSLPNDGAADSLWVYPYDALMLSGATLQMTAKAADRSRRAATLPAVSYAVEGGVGTVDQSGLFTAGAAGTGSVTVTGGGLKAGAATVRVVQDPTQIVVKQENMGAVSKLSIKGEESVDLTATAYYNHVDLVSQDKCFTWAVEGDIGTIDETGKFTASNDEVAGNIIVTAGAVSVKLPVTVSGNPFKDMSGHWAEPYTTKLYLAGVISGIADNGVMNYHPDENMTRAQFAVIMCNSLKLTAPTDTVLPFADADTIPTWALDAVKAMYAAGYVKGSGQGDELYFNSNDPITRAEAMTMIGRTLSELNETAPLDFTDAADIPEWAVAYMRTLAAKGVISGYNGAITPLASVTRAQVAKIIASL